MWASSICPKCRMRTIGSTSLPRLTAPTRWVYVELLQDKSAASAGGFLTRLIDKAPFTITKVLTGNGKEFTDRFCATGQRQPTGAHAFDRVCAANRIEHRLTKPRTPQTNGMSERFNGRIAEVLATTRFDSAEHLADTIKRYVKVYNQHIPQKALGHIPPLQAMKNWSQKQPQLFKKCVYNLAGLDSYSLPMEQETPVVSGAVAPRKV